MSKRVSMQVLRMGAGPATTTEPQHQEHMSENKKLNTGILEGVGYKIDKWLGGPPGLLNWERGNQPRFSHKTTWERLEEALLGEIDCSELLTNIYDRIERNRNPERTPSKQNWRFEPRRKRSPKNKSPEVNLERDIVMAAEGKNGDWANQIPVASGFLGPNSDKGRHVDLARKKGELECELIELKVKADNPFYAAMEILCYGLLYVYARVNIRQFEFDLEKSPLLKAGVIHLRVWAPPSFYNLGTTTLCVLEAGLSDALARFAKSKTGICMGFRYYKFPKNTYEAYERDRSLAHIPRLIEVEAVCQGRECL